MPDTTARAIAQRIIASVPEEQQVGMDRALHMFETAIRADTRSAHFAEAADLVQHWHGGAPDVYSPQDTAELLRHVAGGGNPAEATYGHAPAVTCRCGADPVHQMSCDAE